MHLRPVLATATGEAIRTEWVELEWIVLQLFTVLFLIFLNGFFVASEFAIVKVRESQLATLISQGVKRAATARQITAHLDAYLSATQLGITLASLGLGWVGEPFVAHLLHPLFVLAGIKSPAIITSTSLAIAFGIITFLHIVLGELAPKSLAIRQPVPTTLWISRPLRFFHSVFRPAIRLLNGTANFLLRYCFRIAPVGEHELAHSEEELRHILGESARARELSPLGARISSRAFELRHLTARDIATPRTEVVFFNTDDSFEDNLRRAKRSRHTRFPLCRGHLDDSLGLVHMKDIVTAEGTLVVSLDAIKRELPAVPEMMSVERLLEFFLARRAHLALVLDEFGGAAGIVTLDNVIEELIGEIQDEFDAELPDMELAGADEFTVRGGASLHELRAHTGLELESTDVSTIGGYVTSLLGRLPREGDTVDIQPWRVTVIKCDRRHIRRLQFQRKTPDMPPGAGH